MSSSFLSETNTINEVNCYRYGIPNVCIGGLTLNTTVSYNKNERKMDFYLI